MAITQSLKICSVLYTRILNMAKPTEEQITRLNQTISIVRMAQAKGFTLTEEGHTYQFQCPWCKNKQSLITLEPAANIWSCEGKCKSSGNLIEFVQKVEGVSFKHACELLQSDSDVLFKPADTRLAKRGTSRKINSELREQAEDRTLLEHVIDYYHRMMKQSPDVLDYLRKRGINSEAVIEQFKLGYANRSLGYRLPEKNRKQGALVRSQLQRIGLYRKSGHEHLAGSLVIPIYENHHTPVQVYGRKISHQLRKGTPKHLYLPGPHRGVFNEVAFQNSNEIILCESLIDALTFWSHGFHHVTSSFGPDNVTDELLQAFTQYNIKRVLIAFDRDDEGNEGAHKVSQKLSSMGLDVFRIHFPQDMDVNEYALKMTSPKEALSAVIRQAQWIEQGTLPVEINTDEAMTEATVTKPAPLITEQVEDESKVRELIEELVLDDMDDEIEDDSQLVIEPETTTSPIIDIDTTVSPIPESKTKPIDADITDSEVGMIIGNRRYRVRGLERNHNYAHLKVNLMVSCGDYFHVDNLDMYSHKHRISFINTASGEIGAPPEVLKKDLGQVLLKLESLQDEQINAVLESNESIKELTVEERREALTLLQQPDLMEQIKRDFETCGVVGESTNTLVGYLAGISRHLMRPLAVIIQSSSAAGKSLLMDAMLAFVPDEQRITFAAMTGQSLFYMGETSLKHRILAISEEEGAEQASYALKLLQSQGEITIASTGKDSQTGRLITHEYRVEGPVMLFLTTTAIDIDEELLNRCLVLTVNETREQTQRIHKRQREQRTLDGLCSKVESEQVIKRHQHAQRLIKRLHVVNPFAKDLAFSDLQTRTRRDHEKYLTLIDSIALLFQYQRKVKTIEHQGELIEYVEVTKQDVVIANEIASEVLSRSLDELPPQSRKLLQLIQENVKSLCECKSILVEDYRFTQKEVRHWTGWGATQLKIHMKRLVDMEYLQLRQISRYRAYQYVLLYPDDEQELSFLYEANV